LLEHPSQLIRMASVTGGLDAEQQEAMVRHLVRQLESPMTLGRDEKVLALRSLAVHCGFLTESYEPRADAGCGSLRR